MLISSANAFSDWGWAEPATRSLEPRIDNRDLSHHQPPPEVCTGRELESGTGTRNRSKESNPGILKRGVGIFVLNFDFFFSSV